MHELFVNRGIRKQAAAEDGPSFEQQFGIIANAQIVEKFNQLDAMKLAFQLIDKTEDNSDACGCMVYIVGKSVIFVPAFFKNGKLKTGDMMYIAQTQQFLPLSDPWLSWIKDKDIQSSGSLVDTDNAGKLADPQSTQVTDWTDPIIKKASADIKSLYAKGIEFTNADNGSLLDSVVGMGKKATGALVDQLVSGADFMNAALRFYGSDGLYKFSKQASLMAAETPEVSVILPFTKEASSLDDLDKAFMEEHGFVIKRAAKKDYPKVILKANLGSMFTNVTGPGKCMLLTTDGDLKEAIVLKGVNDAYKAHTRLDSRRHLDLCANSAEFMRTSGSWLYVYEDGKLSLLPMNAVKKAGTTKLTDNDLSSIGVTAQSALGDRLGYDSILVFADGTVIHTGTMLPLKSGKGWVDAGNGEQKIIISEDSKLINPLFLENSIIIPKSTRVVKEQAEYPMNDSNVSRSAYVTSTELPLLLREFGRSRYDTAGIYSDGNEFYVSGDKLEIKNASLHEAAYGLISEYGVRTEDAMEMLKQASAGAHPANPKKVSFLIEKKAVYEDPSESAGIGYTEINNQQPTESRLEMPQSVESPENLQKAVETAAANGIKEVFDVTALKLMVRQTNIFDDIQMDIPLFMRTLDGLCRKLFQLYAHTEKMEEKYGAMKLKSLEDTIKNSLDSLSELTIFLKLRTVDGSGSVGDITGELMTGQML